MSMFDPDAFMAANIADAGSTAVEPIPAGEYTATIKDVKTRGVDTKNGPGVVCDIIYTLLAPDVAAKLGRQTLEVKQGMFLDIADGKLDLSKGKNVQLNRVREAVGMNKGGVALNALKGAGPLKVHVTLRPDKNSPDVIYNDVKSVGKMS